jgi:hypothetical protein
MLRMPGGCGHSRRRATVDLVEDAAKEAAGDYRDALLTST